MKISITLKILLLVIITTVLNSCLKPSPLKADFDSDRYQFTGGETMKLINKSTGASRYVWSFPDGSTSTEKNPSYTFPEKVPGNVSNITLTAYSRGDKRNDQVTYSCIVYPAMGKVTFWKTSTCGCNTVDVTIDDWMMQANIPYSSAPGCDDLNNPVYELEVGTYSYTATDGSKTWNGNVTITKNCCINVPLN
jgi:hypothetical protein